MRKHLRFETTRILFLFGFLNQQYIDIIFCFRLVFCGAELLFLTLVWTKRIFKNIIYSSHLRSQTHPHIFWKSQSKSSKHESFFFLSLSLKSEMWTSRNVTQDSKMYLDGARRRIHQTCTVLIFSTGTEELKRVKK